MLLLINYAITILYIILLILRASLKTAMASWAPSKYFLVKIIIIINKRDQAPSRVNVKKR